MRALLVFLALLVLAAPASAADPVRATLKASSTMSVAGTPWRYEILVKDRQGRAVRAQARLHVVRAGAVVGCVRRTAIVACTGGTTATWIAFTGKRVGSVRWPARLVGGPLTFRATVFANGRSLRLRIPVRVRAP